MYGHDAGTKADGHALRDPVSVLLRKLSKRLRLLTMQLRVLQDAHYDEQISWRINLDRELAKKQARKRRR